MRSSETTQPVASPARALSPRKAWATPQMRIVSVSKFTQLEPDDWASAASLS